MSQSYSEVFRPKKPAQLIGDDQRKIAQELISQISTGKYPQEIMFIGPTGTGKTTLVRMCAAAIIEDAEIEEINCGDDTGVDAIRAFIDSMQYYPVNGEKAIYHLAEIHNLTKNAQEALLTKIEPVPPHVVLFASTTDPQKVISTLLGRFDKHYLPVPSAGWFSIKARWMCDAAGKTLDSSLIEEIIYSCNGSVREFDRSIQQALAGTYRSVQLEVEDQKSLLNIMLYQDLTIQDWFQAATRETDFIASNIGICGYCIKILSNKNSKPKQFIRAQVILDIMGTGLSRDISPKVSFHHKLLQIYSEFQKHHV